MFSNFKELFKKKLKDEKKEPFGFEVMIKISALLTNNNSDVMSEVEKSVYDFENYISYYFSDEFNSDKFSHEEYWKRWYPTTKQDPMFFVDYLDNKPTFCWLNMLEWLADKGFIAYIDVAWEYTELLSSLNKLKTFQNIPINFEDIGMVEGDKSSGTVYTDDNLIIANRALVSIGYQLVDVYRGGDCYDLAIVKNDVYNKIKRLTPSLNHSDFTVRSFLD